MKRSRLNPISDKRRKAILAYRDAAIDYKMEHSTCGCCKVRPTSDIHHKKGRVGALLLDKNFWLPVCRPCHRILHDNPAWAYENGFSLRR